mmetsp:Transcript_124775/g.388417  ORF Transcript_124775/g.388417 Transcript_124775/m.388417 type:complete len:291 (+) Transcript_124775:487-1359(+)
MSSNSICSPGFSAPMWLAEMCALSRITTNGETTVTQRVGARGRLGSALTQHGELGNEIFAKVGSWSAASSSSSAGATRRSEEVLSGSSGGALRIARTALWRKLVSSWVFMNLCMAVKPISSLCLRLITFSCNRSSLPSRVCVFIMRFHTQMFSLTKSRGWTLSLMDMMPVTNSSWLTAPSPSLSKSRTRLSASKTGTSSSFRIFARSVVSSTTRSSSELSSPLPSASTKAKIFMARWAVLFLSSRSTAPRASATRREEVMASCTMTDTMHMSKPYERMRRNVKKKRSVTG